VGVLIRNTPPESFWCTPLYQNSTQPSFPLDSLNPMTKLFHRPVGQGPVVADGESVCRRRPYHIGHDLGEQFPGHGLAVALGVI
jgi:hypothetical protein